MSDITKDKSINQMTAAELRAALIEYNQSQAGDPPAELLPDALPPGTSEKVVTAAGLAIMRKNGADLTVADRGYLKQEIARVLAEQ